MDKTNHLNQVNLKDHDFDLTDMIFLRKNDIGRLLLRLAIGGLMLIHGLNKLLYGNESVNNILMSVGIPELFSFGVFIGEVIGPIMLIVGYKVRVGAAFVALNMLVAILLVHASQLAQVNELGGWMIELNALYLLGALTIIFLGSGRYAITKGRGALD